MTVLEYIDNLINAVHDLNDPGKPPLSQTDIINHYLNSLAMLRTMIQGGGDLASVINGAIKDLENVLENLIGSVS